MVKLTKRWCNLKLYDFQDFSHKKKHLLIDTIGMV